MRIFAAFTIQTTMNGQDLKLVISTGCEAFLPVVEQTAQTASEAASSASISASVLIFLYLLIAIVGVAAFSILFISKIGLRERIVATAPSLISQLFDCDFCLSWWTGLLYSCVTAALVGRWEVILIAVIAAPLTRRLIA